MRPPSAAFVPPAEIVPLLRAGLLDGDAARAAWQAGRGELDRPPESVLPAARWLEPLLAANLVRLGIDDPLMPRLRMRYDEAAANNAHLFEHVATLVAKLESSGIQAMLLKGAALVAAGAADPGARPMSDVDLLVPLRDAEKAVAITSGAGWNARHEVTADFLAVKHAAHFADGDNCQLDLHWYVFEECPRPGIDDGIWKRALPAGFLATAAKRPSTADALLHACVHGARWTKTPGVRWVTDAWAQLHRPDMDWPTLLAEAERRRFTARLRVTLRFMERALHAPVPTNVLADLDARRPGLTERLEYASLGYEQRHLGALPSYWFAFSRTADSTPAAIAGFPSFLGRAWGVGSVRGFARAASSRAWRRLRTGSAER